MNSIILSPTAKRMNFSQLNSTSELTYNNILLQKDHLFSNKNFIYDQDKVTF